MGGNGHLVEQIMQFVEVLTPALPIRVKSHRNSAVAEGSKHKYIKHPTTMQSPLNLLGEFGLLIGLFIGFALFALRYALIAGIAYFICYFWKKEKLQSKKIQAKFPEWPYVAYEIRHSMQTALIFTGLGLLIRMMRIHGFTQMYTDIEAYGWLYFAGSFVMLAFIHDAYFYWMHWSMHHFKWLKKFHAVHHHSHNPTPWAAFSFHPVEALLEFGFVPVVVLLLPMHPLTLFLFSLWSLGMNVLGHLGYELFPPGATKHPLLKWMNTATHHNMHHQAAKYNYGLYFNIWDRLMHTNHPEYERTFNKMTER
jgi:sterol desaturase/sphingolipid hydroxylase (fatty acid hydroxylase superfamily)